MNKNKQIVSQHMAMIGRKGGSACTDKQNAARRLNGLKGGRPKGSTKQSYQRV